MCLAVALRLASMYLLQTPAPCRPELHGIALLMPYWSAGDTCVGSDETPPPFLQLPKGKVDMDLTRPCHNSQNSTVMETDTRVDLGHSGHFGY